MLRCMYSGISGMKVNQTKLDVIGNNIANVGTTAFKGSQARFTDMLYQNAGVATAPTSVLGGTNSKQVGLGAKLSSINKLMSQGNALSTGRALDVCVDGEGYLVVAKGPVDGTIDTTDGTSTGGGAGGGGTTTKEMSETLYTRDGNLTLDEQGNLVTADGHRVMGYYLTGTSTGTNPASATVSVDYSTGEPVVSYVDSDAANLHATDTSLHPLAIPDSIEYNGSTEKIASFEIGKDGVITAILGNGKRSAIGQIAMADFKNPEALKDVGGNMSLVSSNSGSAIYKTGKLDATSTSSTTEDNSGGFGDFVQGTLEASNVDLTEQFTDMITATRSFQAASKMISTGDEILQTITGLIR
ncbi:flagellar hook-basal body protein [Clostridium sp. DL-VIII]|uniref:flagellar hook-basal body complex protein n=1 Tax=Clostridium sp. DL-VIII TaxID=641107 RepID=UPI00023B05D6|nr:flagellar hook-basal body complex protein [Clostridium sp. DL-VIII]EHJ01476.1 flagellar hook-basal body protein [Clostridium sp. DL-VIII]